MNSEKGKIVIQVNSGMVETLLIDKKLECLLDIIDFVVKDVESTSSFPLNSDIPMEEQYDPDYGIEINSYSPAIEVIDSETYIEGSLATKDQENPMMRVWLDDTRPLPTGLNYTHLAKSADEAIELIKTGQVSHISFDHDLGDNRKTGYDVACYIEKEAVEGRLLEFTWGIHSQNPVGAENIRRAMLNAEKAWDALNHTVI